MSRTYAPQELYNNHGSADIIVLYLPLCRICPCAVSHPSLRALHSTLGSWTAKAQDMGLLGKFGPSVDGDAQVSDGEVELGETQEEDRVSGGVAAPFLQLVL